MKSNKDRQIIEDYLKLYCLEELFDEIINSIIEKKPLQPFQYISNYILLNSMPEILKVKISSRIIGNNNFGIYVEILSNIGTFVGITSQSYDIDNHIPVFHDYSLIELRIEEVLLPLDPQDFTTIDQILGDLYDIDPPIILATSIACLRMSAKYQNIEVYNLISNLCGVEPSIPLPVPTVLTRMIDQNEKKYFQYYHIYPLSSSNLPSAMETIVEFYHRLNRLIGSLHYYDTPEKINKLPPTILPSSETLELVNYPIHVSQSYCGSITIERISMEHCLKFLTTIIEEDGENLPVRISVDCQGSLLSFHNQTNHTTEKSSMTYSYFSQSSSLLKTNIESVESLVMLWKEYEVVSFEDPFHLRDRLPYLHMKMKIEETMVALRNDEARELQCAQRGIGLDESCPLQIVIDQHCKTPQDIHLLGKDFSNGSVNTIKFRLEKFSTITRAIAFCKAVYENKWNLIISCNEESPETYDTFLADFAVGVGAFQFMGGGLNSCEYNCKYNRLLEIQHHAQTSIPYVGSRYQLLCAS